MKSSHRHAAAAVGIVALSLMGAPLFAQGARNNQEPPQRGGPPNDKTPYILIATFQSPDRKLGVEMANELRHRVQSEHQARELYVVPKANIDATLGASGYPPDSALNAADLMELSRQLHGEYVVDGKVTKTGQGDAVRVDTRVMIRAGQSTLAQPLPVANGKDPGDAAKMIERSITEMIKGMPSYRTCIDDLRAQKNDEAAAAARAGIAAYPNSVLSRICLLNAYSNAKAPADSIIAVATQILSFDPNSMLALANLADAYTAKGDKDKAIETNLRIYRADPSNQAVAQSIVQQLAQSGAPDKALPIIDSLIKDNPADVGMLRTKWLLQLNAKMFKQAMTTGEELAKLDTAAASLDWFNRQIGAAQGDSNSAKVLEYASKAAQKFPKDESFDLLLAQQYRKAGQLQQSMQAARRATELDPKDTRAWVLALYAANDMNQTDTLVALVQRGIAAGADKSQLGPFLAPALGAAVKKAQESKTRADWEAALNASKAADALVSSPETNFYIGVSSFSLAANILGDVQDLAKTAPKKKEDAAKACTLAKEAEDYLATTAMSMPKGGSVDKNTAGQILGAAGQYGEFITSVKKAFCPK